MNKILVVLVDDHPMYRQGVATILSSQPDILIVGEGASAKEALSLVSEHNPDVALIDINMPGGGVAAAEEIARLHPGVKVMMLTASEDEDDLIAACAAGVLGYIVKGISGKELLKAVRRAAIGHCYLSPKPAAA